VLNVASRSITTVPSGGPMRLSAVARLWRRPAPSSPAPSSYEPMGSD
jgi:hypothetical protein